MSALRTLLLILLMMQMSWAQTGDTIVVGSKNFTESRLLGEIMAQVLEAHTDLKIERKFGIAGAMMAFEATKAKEIDLYPGYTGTAATAILKLDGVYRDPLKTYAVVSRYYRNEHDLTWMTPFGFNNTYVLAVPKRVADKWNLKKLSDLKVAQDEIRLGVTHEFLKRPDGLPGLQEAYGLEFPNARGVEHGLAYRGISEGEVDLIDAYSTDGELLRYKLISLEDDKQFFPPYHAAPIVRTEVIEKHPEVEEALHLLGYTLTDETMQGLNYQVQEEKRPVPEVAHDFLKEQGLVKGELKSKAGARDEGFWKLMVTRKERTMRLTGEHLWLTAVALFWAILVGVPLGIFITRSEGFSQPVLSVAGIIQTIPSIALLAFLIPFLGMGGSNAVMALFLYALLPIIRNTYTGIKEVEPRLVEAARAMGLTERQILTMVELPLAIRTIMAGVRTSGVINVGVATLAAFIGAGGLGDPIVTGLQLNDINLVLAGALPAALLAIAVDQGLGLLERVLAPRT